MLKIPTVFVTGAGSSEPFGFPTGIQLSRFIYNNLADGGPLHRSLRDFAAFADDQIEDFRQSFYHSAKSSVDAFLEYRTDLIPIGKAAIAAALVLFEVDERLFVFDWLNWLRALFARLSTSFDEFSQNTISFVTFNYDRSIEHFLFSALKNSHKRSDDEVIAAVTKIPVIHLHGRLGNLPWQSTTARPYNQVMNVDVMKQCIDGIKIIHESISDGRDADFNRAKELLNAAEQIVILGLGYAPTNVQRLALDKLAPGKAIGSCVGLGLKDKEEADTLCGGKVKLLDQQCTYFVTELVRWS